jgi:hypothetical protein
LLELASFLIDIFYRKEIGLALGKGNKMQILFFSSKHDENEARLAAALLAAIPGKNIEHYNSLVDLRERLRSIVEPASVVVLVATDLKELEDMQAFRDMLTEIYVILVIPDWQESTVKLAYILKPRFLSVIEDDFLDLSQIVAKITRTAHEPSPARFAAKNISGDSRSLPKTDGGQIPEMPV